MPDGGTTNVDILSLEDFRATLDTRLTDAEAAMTALQEAAECGMELGIFADAQFASSTYKNHYIEHLEKAARLVAAIKVAQTSTDTIISEYKDVEARNAASAADISEAFGENEIMETVT